MPNNSNREPEISRVKKLLLEAMEKLHQESKLPQNDQWFARAAIARKLENQSGKLNPVRINALEELVEQGSLFKRQKPNDGRELPQYSLYKPDGGH
jgi:hypothetical protein